jgi:signal transduction histidine kinase
MTAAERTLAVPNRSRLRTRLAVGLSACALGVAALVAVASALLAAWRSDDPANVARAGAARVGSDLAVVIVTGEGADSAAADARRAALQWMLVALGVSLVPAVGLGWFAAGRLLGSVDRALADTQRAEAERQRRLQEVVHELRTPLTVVGVNLELAASSPDLDADTATLVDAARRATERMGRTIDDLAGHGRLAVTKDEGPVDVAAVVRSVVGEHIGPARARGLTLVCDDSGAPTVPDADRQALRTMVGNLLTNAVRVAPSGSVVRVEAGELAGWAWIAVRDDGPGLPERLHARVFERGWRGRHERDRASATDSGRGLGLTISRQLAEAHGGKVTIHSSEGDGATFTVWLPLAAEARAADVVAADGIHPAVLPWLRPAPAVIA